MFFILQMIFYFIIAVIAFVVVLYISVYAVVFATLIARANVSYYILQKYSQGKNQEEVEHGEEKK